MDDVESSARARQNSCSWPAEKPRSEREASRPPGDPGQREPVDCYVSVLQFQEACEGQDKRRLAAAPVSCLIRRVCSRAHTFQTGRKRQPFGRA